MRRKTGPSAAQVKTVIVRSGDVCEVCGNAMAEQIHHRRPRGAGGSRLESTNGAANLLHICAAHHAEIESKRSWSIVHGWLLQQHQNPSTTPVLLRHGWVLLNDDGEVSDYAHTAG